MIDKTTAERIASAVNVLRPEWVVASLVTLIGDKHRHRLPCEVAAALAWVALDPDSRTPARVNEAGPWWKTGGPVSAIPTPPRIAPGEFRATNPIPSAEAVARIAKLRAIVRDNPPPQPREDTP